MAARRVELERSLENRPSLPKTLDELCGIGVRRHTGRQTLAAFEYACRPGEAVPGHVCGEHSIGRRVGSVELRRVGGVPQELPEACGLRPGRPEGVEHGLFVRAEQVGDGGRRGERPRGPGSVEDLIVGAAKVGADSDPSLVTHYRGGYEVSARSPGLLRGRKGSREYYARRVEDGAVVDVVLLDHVRGGAVHEGGEEGGGVPARNQDLARPVARTHRLRKPLQNLDRPGVPTGERRRDPVQDKLLGPGYDLFGKILEAEVCQVGGQLPGRPGGGHGHLSSPGAGFWVSSVNHALSVVVTVRPRGCRKTCPTSKSSKRR